MKIMLFLLSVLCTVLAVSAQTDNVRFKAKTITITLNGKDTELDNNADFILNTDKGVLVWHFNGNVILYDLEIVNTKKSDELYEIEYIPSSASDNSENAERIFILMRKDVNESAIMIMYPKYIATYKTEILLD